MVVVFTVSVCVRVHTSVMICYNHFASFIIIIIIIIIIIMFLPLITTILYDN